MAADGLYDLPSVCQPPTVLLKLVHCSHYIAIFGHIRRVKAKE